MLSGCLYFSYADDFLPDFEKDTVPMLNEILRVTNEDIDDAESDIDTNTTNVTTNTADITTIESYDLVVQIVNVQTGAYATGSTQMVLDDDKPQKTEGDEYMTLAIEPTSATNTLKIDVVANVSTSGGTQVVSALFQDATTDAIAAVVSIMHQSDASEVIAFTHYMTADTTSETTFKVRMGPIAGVNLYFNGYEGRELEGLMASSITITEYKQ